MKDQENKPVILAFLSAIIFGLASFVVWLLRLSPGIQQKPKSSRSNQLVQDSQMIEPEKAEIGSTTLRSANDESSPLQQSPQSEADLSQVDNLSVDSPPAQNQELEPDEAESTGWTTPTRYLAGVGIFLFILWLINYSQQTLSMLIFAAIIAILAKPFSSFFQKRLRFSQGLAITITYLLVAALIVVIPLILIPNIAEGLNSFANYDWEGLLGAVSNALDQASDRLSSFPVLGASMANTLAGLSQLVQGWLTVKPEPISTDPSAALDQLGQAVGILEGLVGPLISGVMSLVFMLLISLQISLSGEQIRGWIINPVPERYKKEISHLLDRIHLVWVSFLHGEFVLMVVMGLVTWLLNVILGTPQAALLGLLAGLMEVVPSLGPIIATIPAAILALIFGSSVFTGLNPWVFMLIVILGYVLLQAIENQVLVPKILGNAVSLPPLIVLVGVTIAGATAGITGIFLATPIMATGKELLSYVYEKVIAAPEPERKPPEKDQPSMSEQLRGFLSNIRQSKRQEG